VPSLAVFAKSLLPKAMCQTAATFRPGAATLLRNSNKKHKPSGGTFIANCFFQEPVVGASQPVPWRFGVQKRLERGSCQEYDPDI